MYLKKGIWAALAAGFHAETLKQTYKTDSPFIRTVCIDYGQRGAVLLNYQDVCYMQELAWTRPTGAERETMEVQHRVRWMLWIRAGEELLDVYARVHSASQMVEGGSRKHIILQRSADWNNLTQLETSSKKLSLQAYLPP